MDWRDTDVDDVPRRFVSRRRAELPQFPAPAAPAAPAAPRRAEATKIADKVWDVRIGGNGGAVIEFADHLVMFEAYNNEADTFARLDVADALVPGKKVTHVIVSHHHFDHSGGLARRCRARPHDRRAPRQRRHFPRDGRAARAELSRRARAQSAAAEVPARRRAARRSTTARCASTSITPSATCTWPKRCSRYIPGPRIFLEGDFTTHDWDWNWWGGAYLDNVERYGLNPAINIPVHGIVTTFDETIATIEKQVSNARDYCTRQARAGVYPAGCPVQYSRDRSAAALGHLRMAKLAARAALLRVLGTELPIIQAPMAGVQGSALAVAVSNAGGLGSLPCAMLAVEAMRNELAAIRAAHRAGRTTSTSSATRRPRRTPSAKPRGGELLAPYFAEFGIDADADPAGPGRAPFTAEAADVLEEFAPPVVSFHFGLPSPELVARVKRWGSKILSSATTVDEARWLEAHGVDAIIAQGARGGRSPRHLSVRRPQHAGRHVRAGAADRAGGEGAGDRRGRHRRRGRCGGRDGARRRRRAGRHRLSAVPGGDDERRASRGAEERRRPPDGAHESVHRAAGARHREPPDAGARPDQRARAGLPARGRGDRAAAREGRSARQRRLLAAVVPGRTPAAARRFRPPSSRASSPRDCSEP